MQIVLWFVTKCHLLGIQDRIKRDFVVLVQSAIIVRAIIFSGGPDRALKILEIVYTAFFICSSSFLGLICFMGRPYESLGLL